MSIEIDPFRSGTEREAIMNPSAKDYESRRQRLLAVLDSCPVVTRYDRSSEKEAETLAHAFLDLEQSFHKFTDELLPRLESNGVTKVDIADLLLEIGEEFRHILYHIGDPHYYRYLPAWGGADERNP
jgi:hypothetical protein